MDAEQTTRQRIEDLLIKSLRIVFVVVGLFLLLFLIRYLFQVLLVPDIAPAWTGLGEVTTAQRTLWDWLELLIIPAFLAGGAAWIARAQQNRELAEKEIDREIAKEQREQTTLENYFSHMTELLLSYDLRLRTDPSSEERVIARARTLAVLRSLEDENRKGQLMRFLTELNLIDLADPVLSLYGADLRQADLSGVIMNKVGLYGVDLSGADLSNATIREANLGATNLSGADLSNATLEGSDLERANLFEADLSKAKLSMSNLSKANLRNADLSRAGLFGVNLWMADLSGVDLSNVYLNDADLNQARFTLNTKWPSDFDPKAAGVILVDDEGNPVEDASINE